MKVVECHKSFFLSRCQQRNVSIEDAMPCVVSQDGDVWKIDTEHPAYPSRSLVPPQPQEQPTGGPGTELSKLLKRFGIEPTPTCQCRAKAAQMDRWGADECARPERVDEVVAVMRAEAAARGLPFLDLPARLLVKRAIENARKAEATRAREADRPPIHPEQ
jgi:hypothetical protein